jgi:hypothetical protein
MKRAAVGISFLLLQSRFANHVILSDRRERRISVMPGVGF